jgi:RimJ/RimL family protein N-acetyltransferase
VIFGTAPVNTKRLRGDRVVPEDLEPWSVVFLDDEFAGEEWPADRRTPERALGIHDADRAHWDRFGFGPWSVRKRKSGEYVGRVGLSHTRDAGSPEVEMGWLIATQFRGRGYATEIGREAVRVAFEVLELDGLIAFVTRENEPSLAVAAKLGFEATGEVDHQGLPHLLLRLGNAS